jgi:hypothetical protein
MRGVIDIVHYRSAMPLTPPTSSGRCNWHRPPLVSSVIDTADRKIGDFKVDFFGEYKSLFKKL